MSRLSKTIITFLTIHLINFATGLEVDKRGPQGFLGMRGKKLLEGEQFYKRKPQFFVGVKGKKDSYDINDVLEEYYKRAPMGFMGMRGKKDFLTEIFPDDKRAMGFVGMRGKKDLYPDEKRAPMGFVGMRGKKDNEDSLYQDSFEYFPKQGSLIGQIDYNSNEEFPLLNQMLDEYMSKVYQNDVDQSETNEERITNEVEKRGHQFFGVRGKKSVQNKRPYDVSFRGKFIGVRGKKDLKNTPQEIKFLLDGPFPKRKGAMGFVGMRGKKWTDESSPEREN